jgi:molybdopterin-guanine dinucleotide biosynthesis adapter protein
MDETGGLSLDQIEQSFFFDQDIILTEGFKKGDKPKIAVLTNGQEEQLLQAIEGRLLATVGDNPFRPDIPHFKPDDPQGLVNFLEGRFLKDRNRPSVRVILDGKNIPMKDFVQDIIRSAIMGLLTPLKGFFDARRVEIKINRQTKGQS